MADSTKAKYFCENCGSEVAAKARFCPKCGKFFSSVRCPKCGHMGTVRDFKDGCPKCHYAMTNQDIYGDDQGEETADGLKHKLSRKSKKAIKDAFNVYDSKQKHSDSGDAPMWVFIAGIAVLVIICGILFVKCQ